MTSQTAGTPPPNPSSQQNLLLRIGAAVVLVPLALAAAWLGGSFWFTLALVVAWGLFAEWLMISRTWNMKVAAAGMAALGLAGSAAWFDRLDLVVIALGGGIALHIMMLRVPERWWAASGLCYAAVALVASVVLRDSVAENAMTAFLALVFVFAVVWTTDIMGYVVGRTVGGAKLWPRVSPSKTWSGALGSTIGSLVAGGVFAALTGRVIVPMVLLAFVLSVVSQFGDLVESAVKRHFGVKDSSHIIPGHGGVLDRLDGFVAAIAVACLIGIAHGGVENAAQGLLDW